nr:AAA family ATPase [Anaerolinea sp.]
IRAGLLESIIPARPKVIRDLTDVQPHLPQPLTSFIGREAELAEILRMLGRMPSLQPREHVLRLLTLSGAGGCGKTRLALAAAHNLAEAGWYPQGVWWVDLSVISEGAQVAASVARVFGILTTPSTSILRRLENDFREKELLLVLDTCEHLVEAVAAFAAPLLEECPRLQILATSRGPIGIPGETVWRVPSLPFPSGIKSVYYAEEIRRFDSVRLFEERAQAVMPGWSLDNEPAWVAEICSRLDGIPLAIELAAGRLRVMTAEQIAARLDDAFHLLTGGSRSALPRHQTLRACIDWSYDLLSPGEKALLRQLSIFQGDWALDAIEYFDTIDPIPAVSSGECVDILSSLLDHSLVESLRREHEMRYHLLGAIRQFALRKLFEAGEEADARRRYQAYIHDLAARSGTGGF